MTLSRTTRGIKRRRTAAGWVALALTVESAMGHHEASTQPASFAGPGELRAIAQRLSFDPSSIGHAASPTLTVPAGAVRRGSASILGYTNLMVPPAERAGAYATMAGLAAASRLMVDVEHLPLRDVQTAWALQSAVAHRKLVLVP